MYDLLCSVCPNLKTCQEICYPLKKKSRRYINTIWFWSMIGKYCRRCKYDKSHQALHLHHLDKTQKTKNNDTLALWMNESKTYIIKKCMNTRFIILCANCHAELHAKIFEVDKDYTGDNIFTEQYLQLASVDYKKVYKFDKTLRSALECKTKQNLKTHAVKDAKTSNTANTPVIC